MNIDKLERLTLKEIKEIFVKNYTGDIKIKHILDDGFWCILVI